MKFRPMDWLAFVLVIIGAVNWGLVGIANLDLVQLLFGSIPPVPSVVYGLVGLAGLYLAAALAMRASSSNMERASLVAFSSDGGGLVALTNRTLGRSSVGERPFS
jgi:uncharacterized membrane protein YuzA (DUF378 family)